MGRWEGWINGTILIKDWTHIETALVKEDIENQHQQSEIDEGTKCSIHLKIALSLHQLHDTNNTKEKWKSKGNHEKKVRECIKKLMGTTELEKELVEGR